METLETRLEQLERRLEQAERGRAQAQRWARTVGGLAFVVVVGIIAWAAMPTATAQGQGGGGQQNLLARVTALETQVAALQTTVNNQAAQIAALQTQASDQATQVVALDGRTTGLENLLVHFSRSGNDVFITGANLHIRDGSGTTDGAVNGLGNLIVGYNESRGMFGTDVRTGSHNIVAGTQNNFSSFGGLVVGDFNTISGDFASVSGGLINTASGVLASVSGGAFNTASGDYASVSGGLGITQGSAFGWSAGSQGATTLPSTNVRSP